MDVDSIAILAQAAEASGALTWPVVAMAMITAMTSIALSWISYKSSLRNEKSIEKQDAVLKDQGSVLQSVKETGDITHAIVNSKNTALEKGVEDWRDKTIALEKRLDEMTKSLAIERANKEAKKDA